MAQTLEIPIERLTAEAFAPFGEILGTRDGPPQYPSATVKTWAVDFQIDGKVELKFAQFTYKPTLEFTRLERHFNVTQSYFPLGNDASITVFAPPTDPRDRNAVPAPGDLRAFYIGGAQGIMMWKGTWHTGRFPVHPDGARFAFLTDAHTTAELPAVQKGEGRLTQIFDYQKERGIAFRLTDPLGLLPRQAG